MVWHIQDKKGIRLKLVTRQHGGPSTLVFEPSRPSDYESTKLEYLKGLLGDELFRDMAEGPRKSRFVLPSEGGGEVDIDIDPSHPEHEQIEILEALYDEENYEGELDDEFFNIANKDDSEFEEIMKMYDCDEAESNELISEDKVKEAIQEFKGQHKYLYKDQRGKEKATKGLGNNEVSDIEKDHIIQAILNRSSSAESEEKYNENEESKEELDIESVASTYTNTDNRPHLVILKEKQKRTKQPKTEPKPEERPKTHYTIDRQETKEDKKLRKQQVKEEKKLNRERKKALKLLFRSTASKQSVNCDIPPGISLHKQ